MHDYLDSDCKRIYLHLMIECLSKLGYESTEGKLAALVDERERAILALCSRYDEWPRDLDLADAIELVFKEFEKQLIDDFSSEMADARSSEL